MKSTKDLLLKLASKRADAAHRDTSTADAMLEALVHRPELMNDAIRTSPLQWLPNVWEKHQQNIAGADRSLNRDHHNALAAAAATHYAKHGNHKHNVERHSDFSDDVIVQKNKYIENYSEGSASINHRLLRSRKLDSAARNVSDALKSLSAPLEHETHVYSSTSGFNPSKSFATANGVIHMPSFVSTSIHPTFAAMWGKTHALDTHGEHHVIHFILPKGYNKGGYIHDHSTYPEEHEFLLQPKQKWRLVNHEVTHTRAGVYSSPAKRHIWSVVPHTGKFAAKEAFEHDHDALYNHTFTDPALDDVPSTMRDEHNTLKYHKLSDTNHIRAVRTYTNSSYIINKNLIAGTDQNPLLVKPVKHLHEMFDHTPPLKKEHHVYASLGHFNPYKALHDSDTFKTPAFISTSIDPKVAMGHANLHHIVDAGHGETHHHILHLTLPEGYTGGQYVGAHSTYRGETEVILRPNQRFRITHSEELKLPNGITRHVHHAIPLDHRHNAPIHETSYHTPQFFKHGGVGATFMSTKARQVRQAARDIRDDARREGMAQYAKHSTAVPYSHSLEHYIGAGSRIMNAHLLGEKAPANSKVKGFAPETPADIEHTERHIQGVKKSISESPPLQKDTHVYSGLSFNPKKHFEEAKGVFHTPAFTSTSFDPSVSTTFATRHTDENEDFHFHVLHFHLPKGYNRGVAPPNNTGEREYILDTDQKWQLTGHKRVVSSKTMSNDRHRFTHIWSVKPYEEALKEASFHSHHFFKSSLKTTPPKNSDRFFKANHAHNNINHTAAEQGFHEYRKYSGHETVASLPIAERATLRHFIGIGSREMNVHILTQHQLLDDSHPLKYAAPKSDAERQQVENHISNVKSAISKAHPLEEDTHVYSGLGYDPSAHFNHSDGVIHTPAFTSTSFKPRTATWFTKTQVNKGVAEAHVLHFHLPKGYKNGISPPHNETESEYVLNAGQKWKLTNYRKVKTADEGVVHIWSVKPHDENVHERYNPLTAWTNNSKNVNKALATDTLTRGLKARATRMSNLMTPHQDDAFTIYHGTKDRGFTVGQTHTPKVFVSGSHDEHVATRFALSHAYEAGSSDAHVLAITVHPGVKALHIGNDKSSYDEHETVLGHSQPMTIERHEVKHVTHPNTNKPYTVHIWHASMKPSVNEAFVHDKSFHVNTNKSLNDLDMGDTSEWLHNHQDEHNHLAKLHDFDFHKDEHVHSSMNAISSYTASSQEFNHPILENKTPHHYHHDLVHALTSAAALTHDHHVYSSVGGFDPASVLDESHTFKTTPFVSTSINPEIAAAHHVEKANKGVSHIIHFHLPKGYNKGRYIAPHSEYPDEGEFLLAPDQKWHVNEVTSHAHPTGKEGHVVHVWHVSPHDPSLHEAFKHNDKYTFETRKAIHHINIEGSVSKGFIREHRHLSKLHEISDENKMHRYAIERYTASSYNINKALINENHLPLSYHPPSLVDSIHHLKAATKDVAPLQREHHVYSSTGSFNPTNVIKRGVFKTPAFVSTSIDPKVAAIHAQDYQAEKHIIHFTLPKGFTKGRYVAPHSSFSAGEGEFILHPNQKWKVDKITHHDRPNGVTHVYHVSPYEPKSKTVTETTRHRPDVFNSIITVKKQGRPFIAPTLTPKMGSLDNDVKAQHSRLASLHRSQVDDSFGHRAVEKYVSKSKHINDHLLGFKGAGFLYNRRIAADNISNHIAAHAAPLNEEVHAYSGLGNFNPSHHFHGGTIHMPSFVSSSIDPVVAMNFTPATTSPASPGHIIHFHLPIGYKKGLYVDGNLSKNLGERELLLDKGQRWKLTGVQHSTVHVRSADPRVNKTHHYKIWSVEPALDNIHETTFHDKNVYRNGFYTPKTTSRYNEYNSRQHKLSTAMRKDVSSQDLKLRKAHSSLLNDNSLGFKNLSEYTSSSKIINNTLVKNHSGHLPVGSDAIASQQKHLERAAKISETIERHSSPLDEETHTYSGLKDYVPNVKVGDVLHTPAFTSSSIRPAVAGMFTRPHYKGDDDNIDLADRHILHFKLPKGYKRGLYVEHVSQNSQEYEYLLDKGQNWKVTNHQKVVSGRNKNEYMTHTHIWTLEPHHD